MNPCKLERLDMKRGATHPGTRWRQRSRRALFVSALLVTACRVDAPTSARLTDAANLAKGGGAKSGPAVASVQPSFARQDTTLDVRVFGSGFAEGASVRWSLGGDTTKIRVNGTQVVSATELRANITVLSDAPVALYDVEVTNRDGKKGIGAERFEVTTAEVVGSTGGDAQVYAISESGQVAGYAATAFVFEDGAGLTSLGTGQAWGIDPSGTAVVGRNGLARAWIRQGPGVWIAEDLPRSTGSVGGNAASAVRAGDGSLIVAGWDQVRVSRKQSLNRPALWRRVGTGWTGPVLYTHPGTAASAWDATGAGVLVGRATMSNGSMVGVVWENEATWTILDGLPLAINESGTLVVGTRGGAPALWWRNAATGQWNATGVPLPQLASGSCETSFANGADDVNDAGIVVGGSCAANGKIQATWWRLDLSATPPAVVSGPHALPGLGQIGVGAESSHARAVTKAAPWIVAGSAQSEGNTVAVRWLLP
jgi:hypothetical protein